MKTRHLLAGALLMGTLWLSLYGDKTPSAPVVEAVSRPKATATVVRTAKALPEQIAILQIRSRRELIGNTVGPVEALFGSHNWTPPPPPPPPAPRVVVAPPPKPTAPPLPFTYIGKKLENGNWEAYLARGTETYIVHNKTMIDDTYRAEMIVPPNLTITYLPLKQVQTLTIGDAE